MKANNTAYFYFLQYANHLSLHEIQRCNMKAKQRVEVINEIERYV